MQSNGILSTFLMHAEVAIVRENKVKMSWLLMPWLLASPGHQQSWYYLYLCKIFRCLFSFRKVLATFAISRTKVIEKIYIFSCFLCKIWHVNLSIHFLTFNHWSLGIHTTFLPAFNNGSSYLSMLESKFIHVPCVLWVFYDHKEHDAC